MHWTGAHVLHGDFKLDRNFSSYVFQQVGIDPAVASGPLITTINDLIAVIVYYGLSWLFLLEMMHF